MEKTAIDLMIEKIAENPSEGYYTINGKNVSKEIEEAKAIFRQQIEDAYECGYRDGERDGELNETNQKDISEYDDASQFYTTKYGG